MTWLGSETRVGHRRLRWLYLPFCETSTRMTVHGKRPATTRQGLRTPTERPRWRRLRQAGGTTEEPKCSIPEGSSQRRPAQAIETWASPCPIQFPSTTLPEQRHVQSAEDTEINAIICTFTWWHSQHECVGHSARGMNGGADRSPRWVGRGAPRTAGMRACIRAMWC